MPASPQPKHDMFTLLKALDGQSFKSYQQLLNTAFYHDRYHIRFVHLQGSPGAFPASVCHLRIKIAELGLADWRLSNMPRKMATADYLLRAFHAGVITHARQNRGAQGSGSFQPLFLSPQVLKRNVVRFDKESEAAAIIEAVLAGAKLLLIDEDSSATNFLIKDHSMRKLIPQDTITPFFDRVQELFQRFGISTLIVVGGSSEYLGLPIM